MDETSSAAAPNRKKRNGIIALLALALVAIGSFYYFKGKEYHVIVSQAQIDAALKEKFPISKTHLVIIQLTYSNPRLKLLPDSNRIEVGLDANVNIKMVGEAKPLSGSVLVTSGLTYNNETKQFFLSEPEIKQIAIQGVPQQYVDKVTDFASRLAREYLQEFPVYTLKATDTKKTAAKLLLKKIEIKNSEVDATLGY
jgi:hypothetical protein